MLSFRFDRDAVIQSAVSGLPRKRKDTEVKITLDCVSCILRRAFQTCEIIGLDDAKKEVVAREILKVVSDVSFEQTTGYINREVHRLIREMSGVEDPYINTKSFYTDLALRAYPELKQTVQDSDTPLHTAVRIALSGASVDYVFNGKPDIVTLFNNIESVLTRNLAFDHIEELEKRIAGASTILYLADNAGETVFDRILIEELPMDKVVYAVKGGPIMNDATYRDAEFAGIVDLVEVMDNGSDAPGTIVAECSEEFRKRFQGADVVISKGQANYKTLKRQEREIFHIFRVKCSTVARDLECAKNDLVVKSSLLCRNGKKLDGRGALEAAS
jgi:uncharacterized protein with ATP-grasp and redox domains